VTGTRARGCSASVALAAQFVGSTAGLASKGLKKIAIIYCVESTACTNYYSTLTRRRRQANGQTVVYSASTSLTQPTSPRSASTRRRPARRSWSRRETTLHPAGLRSAQASTTSRSSRCPPLRALRRHRPNVRKDGASLAARSCPTWSTTPRPAGLPHRDEDLRANSPSRPPHSRPGRRDDAEGRGRGTGRGEDAGHHPAMMVQG